MDNIRKLLQRHINQKDAHIYPLIQGTSVIRSARKALGISCLKLALRIPIDQSRISRLEKAERSGSLKLSTLRKIAAGLDMDLIYGFVPKDTLKKMESSFKP